MSYTHELENGQQLTLDARRNYRSRNRNPCKSLQRTILVKNSVFA
jgi:hypothetical protein